MATEVKANLGKKLTEQEQKAVDRNKAVQLRPTPKDAPVQGQEYLEMQVCPYCGCVGYGWESAYEYKTFICHCCGRAFRA
jgi:hypothetical protein